MISEDAKKEIMDFVSDVQKQMLLSPFASHRRDIMINDVLYKEMEKRGIKPVYDNRKDLPHAD